MDYQIVAFTDQAKFRAWLTVHSQSVNGIWLQMYKKASNVPSITYAQALDEALCFGWIDGQKKSYDEASFLQKFTPRRPKSMWSKRNIEHIGRLTELGLMMPAGLAEVERAKADGRWAAAYDTPSEMIIPDEFLAELKKHPVAEKFFATLNKTNTYAIAWRLQTAKTKVTRKRRQDKIIALLNAEQKLH
ncbi:MAG TPA: YdeI/OmpD-associated family protein [Candidatus Saccharimonadales bacterium]|nr:YdeI/OmpD-associated family protein [Candidatus Saccharimonadales bacterium]